MAAAEPLYSVIVVGAGIAGLAAAKELLPRFPDLLIVEASHRRGGRILQVSSLSSFRMAASHSEVRRPYSASEQSL